MLQSPSEIDAMTERIDRLEQENQRQRETISDLLDLNAWLKRHMAELGKVLWRS